MGNVKSLNWFSQTLKVSLLFFFFLRWNIWFSVSQAFLDHFKVAGAPWQWLTLLHFNAPNAGCFAFWPKCNLLTGTRLSMSLHRNHTLWENVGCGILLEVAAPVCCARGHRELLAPMAGVALSAWSTAWMYQLWEGIPWEMWSSLGLCLEEVSAWGG